MHRNWGAIGRIKIGVKILALRVKHNPTTSEVFSFSLLLAGILMLPLNKVMATSFLMRSHRNTRKLRRQIFIEGFLHKFGLFDGNIMDKMIPVKSRGQDVYPGRVFKIKEASNNEKGVLILTFNNTFTQLKANYDMGKILSDYYVVLEPSYSGYCNAEILQFLEYQGHKIIVEAADKTDYDFLTRMNGNLVPVDIGSANWVDDRTFKDLKLTKEYDCIMVAMWNEVKRHHLLFRAIKDISDPTYRVCLVGKRWGLTRHDIEAMANYYGIEGNIDIFENIPPDEVNILLNKSRVNLLLSLKEGGNKSVFEGFFANVPVIMLKNHIGINKNHINEHTGVFIDEKDLAKTLVWFRKEYARFRPRNWAMTNISPRISAAKLEARLKQIAHQENRPWTNPIVPKVNRPECQYYDESIRLTPLDFAKYRKTSIKGLGIKG